jgi:large subunit ribosomal protein L5e
MFQLSFVSLTVCPRYIFGGHVAEYMETLADDDEERYKSQFQKYIDDGIEGELDHTNPPITCSEVDCFLADGLEEVYEEAHAKIREDPNLADENREAKGADYWKSESQKYRSKKLTREQRRERVQKKIQELTA